MIKASPYHATYLRRLCFLLFAALLSGCASVECGWQSKFVDNDSSHDAILQWADSEIFSRKFSSEQVFGGRMAGPGNTALRIHKIGIQLPSEQLTPTIPVDILNFEVRLIGSNLSDPLGVFIGQSSYRGIIIARNNLADTATAGRLSIKALSGQRGRVALVCVTE